ncbi:YitT family protein [Clostridium sp. CM028]|uniref:YitT family protein n=1 Tax=Clostridium sp. CM028 TaxID=2851575 RepID=UPI001C6EED72|nr:YitT family protein [Clostridium sp. CM028]MBW9148934.1 YitT family protein [Clostridium sp. CM028]WLC62966.1 YitT family protein [Clostridium sp. CM028]
MKVNTILNKQNIKNAFFVILGCLLSAIGVNMFLVNAKLFSGGLSGMAILIQYALKVPAGYTVLLANIPLLSLSYRKLNKRFTIYSMIGTVSLSLFLVMTKSLSSIITVHDALLISVYGGVLMGAGAGLAYSNHGSEGGMNIIVMLIKKKCDSFDVGQLGFIVNCVIVFLGMLLNGITIALYTLMSMYIAAFVTDKIIRGLSRKKVLLIITDKEEEVCEYITNSKHRGATILKGNALTGKERKVIYCIVHVSKLPEFKYSVQKIDEDALISIIDASEVDGRGFNSNIL